LRGLTVKQEFTCSRDNVSDTLLGTVRRDWRYNEVQSRNLEISGEAWDARQTLFASQGYWIMNITNDDAEEIV
jgi:hypothetical protein